MTFTRLGIAGALKTITTGSAVAKFLDERDILHDGPACCGCKRLARRDALALAGRARLGGLEDVLGRETRCHRASIMQAEVYRKRS